MRHLALLTTALTALFTPPAMADYFVWQDAKSGATLAYPDTWKMINNQKPDTRLTLVGPSQADRPTCTLRSREDKRFTVYPVWYSNPVQRVAYSNTFWNDYLGDYDNVQLYGTRDEAGLGRAFASMAIASYQEPGQTDKNAFRSSQMWGGVYYDTAYILECSAASAAFNTWQPDFLSIAKSVDMRKVVHELATGDYRNFLTDSHLTHPVVNGTDKMGQTYP